MRIASGSTNGKPTPACLKGQGLDSQNKAHLHTWVGFAAEQCAERRVDQWSEQLARPAMDQLGPSTCGRVVVSAPCRACGAAKVLALAMKPSPIGEWLVSVPQTGLSLGSVGSGQKATGNLSGSRVRYQWAIEDQFLENFASKRACRRCSRNQHPATRLTRSEMLSCL